MRSTFAAVSVLSLASVAAAAGATYGRFSCTIVNGDGTYSPDQSQCADANLAAPGANEADTGNQGDRPNPTNAQCVQQTESGAYACGIAGAACTVDANCDNGKCVDQVCQGGFTQGCGADDLNCSGFLYCLDADLATTASDTCGGLGAYCQDYAAADPSLPKADVVAIFNQYCSSGYCSYDGAVCSEHVTTVGGDCSFDPDFACTQTSTGEALTCGSAGTCELAAVPSGRARARRNLSNRSLCPTANEEACAVEGGFQCIDTTSNLENCGGCGSLGTDCTALEGVASVSCEQSSCSIWACADGYTFDAESQACVSV
ncbi:uncharacterized protein JCM15063_001772 [Sporobolomyces koalae]|uniref:uncharacterized protein n=1 Tax=Sporobolomyces koalae TaxID=500713 RepID=UPI00316B85F3